MNRRYALTQSSSESIKRSRQGSPLSTLLRRTMGTRQSRCSVLRCGKKNLSGRVVKIENHESAGAQVVLLCQIHCKSEQCLPLKHTITPMPYDLVK